MTGDRRGPAFRLRFPLSEVGYWAPRYAYEDDLPAEQAGARAREHGHYTYEDFLLVARWKTPRSQSKTRRNSPSLVEETTRIAFATPEERLRIEVLTLLDGVGVPTASVLLHLGHRDCYPIVDYRALWSLGVDPPPAYYSFQFWCAYTQCCRALAAESGVSMRVLDRALWQYSKEHQPSTRASVRATPDVLRMGTATSKSAVMRSLYEEGQTVAQVAKALNVNYSFAYGVHRRWRDSDSKASPG